MKNFLRLLLLVTVAGSLGLSACSKGENYGATNVEDGSAKHIDGDQNNVGGDSAVAGLRRNHSGTTQEQTYDSADLRTGRARGKSER